MVDCCIIFGHYKSCELTRYHYALLRNHNPDLPVIPVHCNEVDHLPGSVNVGAIDPKPTHKSNHRSCDQIIFRFYRTHLVPAERYVYLEWDARATIGVREFYSPVWAADAAATRVHRVGHSRWPWFREVRSLPQEYQASAAGVAPLNGLMLSAAALEGISSDSSIDPDIWCELRVGTLLTVHGYTIEAMPWWRRTNKWFDKQPARHGSGGWIHHPIKKFPESTTGDQPLLP